MNVEARLRKDFPELFEEAMQEGRAEGRAEVRSEIAVNMLREHLPVEMIQRYTEMSADKIMDLARSAGLEPVT